MPANGVSRCALGGVSGPQGRVTLARFVGKDDGRKRAEYAREMDVASVRSSEGKEREDPLVGPLSRGVVGGEWVGGGLLARGGPLSGKSAGVRTEMLRDRVGRGCPLTT